MKFGLLMYLDIYEPFGFTLELVIDAAELYILIQGHMDVSKKKKKSVLFISQRSSHFGWNLA